MNEHLPRAETRGSSNRDRFPSPEDWIALQGGRPRVFRNPQRPHAAWKVVHVYEEHSDPAARFQSGMVVDTLADRTNNIGEFWIPERVILASDGEAEMVIEAHGVALPTFMVRALHGEHCEARSLSVNGDPATRVKNQPAYERLIADFQKRGLQEVRFTVDANDRFILQPLSEIAAARPLAETA